MVIVACVTCGAAAAQEFGGREKLRAHSAEFRREVIKVTNGVWVAVGFSDANSVLIEGDGGSIVVDTTSDVEDAFASLTTPAAPACSPGTTTTSVDTQIQPLIDTANPAIN